MIGDTPDRTVSDLSQNFYVNVLTLEVLILVLARALR